MDNITLSGVHPQDFIAYGDDDAIDEGASALVSLERLQNQPDIRHVAGRLGLKVDGDTDWEALKAVLDGVSLVVIEFPVFNDGRGFSLGVRLRKDLGYTGEIRAVGHVIPDQAQFLLRAGFDSAEVSEQRRDAFERAKSRFKNHYQCSINGDLSAARLRHGAKPESASDANREAQDI